jgi:hypothetical protein
MHTLYASDGADAVANATIDGFEFNVEIPVSSVADQSGATSIARGLCER